MEAMLAFLAGAPMGAVSLLIVGPIIRFIRYIFLFPLAPLKAYTAMSGTNYRGLVIRSFWYLVFILSFFALFATDITGKAFTAGCLAGVIVARIGYNNWDRRGGKRPYFFQ